MKRKLALLMAAVMTLTLLPSMNAFAATGQSLSVTPNVVPRYSVIYEQGEYQGAAGNTTSAKSGPIRGPQVDSKIEYAVDGTDLILDCLNDVKVGDTFRITLENAHFFLRGESAVNDAATGNKMGLLYAANSSTTAVTGIVGVTAADVTDITGTNYYNRLSEERWTKAAVRSSAQEPGVGTATSPVPAYTNYDITKGLWAPSGTSSTTGSYVRFGAIASLPANTTSTGTDIRDDVATSKATLIAAINYLEAKVTAARAAAVLAGTDPAVAEAAADILNTVAADATYVGEEYGLWDGTDYAESDVGGAIIATDNRASLRSALADLVLMTTADITREQIKQYGVTTSAYTTAEFADNANATLSNPADLPYVLQLDSSNDRQAVVTVLSIFDGQTRNDTYNRADYWEFRIPMVVRTDDTGDIKVNISAQTAPVTTGTISLFSQTTKDVSTKAYIDDEYAIARTDFDLDPFVIAERRLYSIGYNSYESTGVGLDNDATSGTFTLIAPTGFEWKDPNRLVTSGSRVWNPAERVVNLGVEAGLSWSVPTDGRKAGTDFTVGSTTASSRTPGTWTGLGLSGTYNLGGVLGGVFGNYSSTTRDTYSAPYSVDVNGTIPNEVPVTPHNDYRIYYKNQGTSSEDRSTLVVELYNLMPSTDLMGKLYIEGLGLIADETAKYGDVLIEVRDDRNWPAGVSDETNVKVAERKEWDIILRTVSDIPTLVNGRYNKVNPLDSTRGDHQTARVRFEEASVNAWWADRQTVFLLPEWAKFRMVDFVDGDELQDAYDQILFDNLYTSNLSTAPSRDNNVGNGIYINDGEKHGAVTINGNQMTLDNLRVNADERAWFEMDMWISIESGRTGDVQLSVSGSAIPTQSNGGAVAPITIAKAVNPVNVTAKITDVKIGYQYQPTYDIIVTETAAGMLEKDKAVYISISDLMSTDMQFSPDTRVAVTGGNLKLRNISNTAIANTSVIEGTTILAGTGGTISFNIDMASSQASTITVSNVSVKIDRTVPETNKYPYKAIAWGPAVAPNYIYYEYVKDVRDKHNVPGIMADYIKVVSSANDKSSILSQEVRVTIGETFFTVNGVSYDMDAAAYISTASNSTMVPVRFISNAFGISNDQVIWDNGKKTVTIVSPIQIVQFTAGSSTMLLDGSAVTMYSPDNLEVMAEIVGDRCYVPFRAMGQAFGISVEWDDATQSAIYNPGAFSGTADQAAADETTATTAE